MDNEPRNRSTSPRCPALGSAHRAKGLLQAIVSPWQVSNLIAEKQMGSIAVGHFEKLSDSLLPTRIELAYLLLHMHQDQQKTQLALFCGNALFP